MPTIEEIQQMSATEIVALDLVTLDEELFHAAQVRITALSDASQAKRDAAAERAKKAREMQRAAFRADVLPELEAEHGKLGTDIAIVYYDSTTDAGAVVVKRPKPIVYKRFADQNRIKTDDVEKLVRGCRVYPSAEDFDALCERLPALPMICGNTIHNLARGGREAQGKE